jgi:hypothetical protein
MHCGPVYRERRAREVARSYYERNRDAAIERTRRWKRRLSEDVERVRSERAAAS